MAYRKRFCVVCGSEETQDVRLIRGLCPKCSAAEKPEIEVRTVLAIKFCRICGSLEERGKWLTPTARGLKEDLLTIVEADAKRLIGNDQGRVSDVSILRMPTSVGSNSILIPVCIRTMRNDPQCPQLVRTFNAKIKLVPTICPNCSLIKQKYYEATLQIRASSGEMTRKEKAELLGMIDALVARAAKKNKQAFISKLEENPAGFDLFLGSRQLAYAIASRFKAENGVTSKETFKAGKVDKSTGKRKDKVTILIKLPKSKMDELAGVCQRANDYAKS
jgi:NMD protein affecting ribosome stability and mRNA decay